MGEEGEGECDGREGEDGCDGRRVRVCVYP